MASAQFFMLALGTLPPDVQVWDLHSTMTLGSPAAQIEGMFLSHWAEAARNLVVGFQAKTVVGKDLPNPLFEGAADMGIAGRSVSLKIVHAFTRALRLLAGGFGATGLDPLQKGGGGFVVRILGDELAGEGLLQDGLAKGVGRGEVGVDFSVQQFGSLKAGVEYPGDFALFSRGAIWNWKSFENGLFIDAKLVVCFPPFSK